MAEESEETKSNADHGTIIDLEKMVIQFTDAKTGEVIKLHKHRNDLFKTWANKASPEHCSYVRFYTSNFQFITKQRDHEPIHYLPKDDALKILAALMHLKPILHFPLSVNFDGHVCFRRCIEGHDELRYKTSKQLQSLTAAANNDENSKLINVYYECRECRGRYSSSVGAWICRACSYKICIACYFGEKNVHFKCKENKHELVSTAVVANYNYAWTCGGCNGSAKDQSPLWRSPCDEDRRKNAFYSGLCIKCYTKGKMMMCDDLHPLSHFTRDELKENDEYKSGSYICQQCTQKFDLTYGSYHCFVCNYDVCCTCYQRQFDEGNNENVEEKDETPRDKTKCYSCCREPVVIHDEKEKTRWCKFCRGIIDEYEEHHEEHGFSKKYGLWEKIEFKEKYREYMPLVFNYLDINREMFRMQWIFRDDIHNKLQQQICYVAVRINNIAIDEDYEREVAICSIQMSLKYHWVFDFTVDLEYFYSKHINLSPKKWSKFETNRPWEPQVECVAPAIATTDQKPEDIEFGIVPIWQFFSEDVLDEKSKFCQNPMGFMRTVEHEINVEVEEPLELESYPFDEQDVPIVFEPVNFAKFIPALDFSNNENEHRTPVVTVAGDAVDAGNWKVAAVLAEFGAINKGKKDIPHLKTNRFSIRIKFRRHWKWVLIQYVFLIFCITALSFTTFVFDIEENVSKLEFVSGLILTLVFIELPKMPVLSILHQYFYASFGFLVLMAVQSAFSNTDVMVERPTLLLWIFGAIFAGYHGAFITLSTYSSWREHKKVMMDSQQIVKNVEERKAFLELNSTTSTENVIFDGENGLFTELPPFSNLRIKKKTKADDDDLINKQLQQELMQSDTAQKGEEEEELMSHVEEEEELMQVDKTAQKVSYVEEEEEKQQSI